MTNKIVIHPDGLCIGRPGPGGWAATLQLWNEGEVLAEKIVFGHHPTKTKNEMELIATIQGLSALKPLGQNVEIATDNRAIINALNDHHARKNKELIQCLQRLAAKHDTTVRTSADQQINEIAQEEAQELSEMLEITTQKIIVFGSPSFKNYKLLERKLDEIIGEWSNNTWGVSIISDGEAGASASTKIGRKQANVML